MTAPKRRPGRPATGRPLRSADLHVRLTRDEMAEVQAMADAESLLVSQWARLALLRAARAFDRRPPG